MPKPGFESLSNECVANEALDLQAQGEDLEAILRALPLGGVRRVLDIGCGTGAMTRAIARAVGPGAVVHGIDISRTHVEQARHLARAEGLDNVRFVEGDFLAGHCGLPAEHDLAVEKYLLMYLVPQRRHDTFLARIREHLRPGGKVVLIEPDVNFGAERYPSPPEPLASVLPRIVEHYRRRGLIEWRCGLQLFHLLHEARFSAVAVHLADGRVIAGGRPHALVEHASRDVEELLGPCLEEMGIGEQVALVASQWRDYLRGPTSFLYTPIFLGEGTAG
jgi:SAM-dependent methyltransferase